MSPASRSKSKDKKASKEPPKGSLKPSSHANTSVGTPASGYNPLLGTFHTFDTSPVPSTSPLHVNGRFRNIDDTDDHNGNNLSGTTLEYDSVSNNGSWSGESEDHKEKTSLPRQDTVPGADNDKREKIRQKNERKHQRQKERRAQELHEKCSGYLMSRKLETLAQQFVAMGFSHDRATIALILNEGRVEESVAWLFESGEEDKHGEHSNLDTGGNLKIDISEELARITDMEIRYKSSKQEVERAIVSCEGDLDKAEEILKSQKDEPPAVPSKSEETGVPLAIGQNTMRVQTAKAAASSNVIQQKRDEKDFNYTKVPVTVNSSVDPATKPIQVLKKIPPKSESLKPQPISLPTDKRWPNSVSSTSTSFSVTSPSPPPPPPPPPSKTEARYMPVGNELKSLQLGSVKEPVIVMQRPQSINKKQVPNANLSSMDWYPPNRVETVKANGFAPPIAVSRSLSPGPSPNSNPLYNQLQYQSQQQFVSSSSSMDPRGRLNGSWAPQLAPASSLGLFSGIGSNGLHGSSSLVDWNTGGSMLQFDYTSIDWSLDRGSSATSPNGLWGGSSYSMQNNARSYESFGYNVGVKSGMRPILANGNGVPMQGLQDGMGSSEQSGSGSREWTSPFEERDIFSLPRHFVSSPTL